MMMRVGSPMASCTCASLVLTVVLLSLSCCSAQIQCPDSILTFNPDGSVDFGSLELPSGADPVDPSYNPGPAGGWYALAAGFVNVVRPGSLPYGWCVNMQCLFSIQSCVALYQYIHKHCRVS